MTHLKLYRGRECGACTECCTQLPIAAGVVSPKAKPAGEACPHLATSGCCIYDRRPATCCKFRCAWLAGADWPEAWRPDQSGLLCLREFLDSGLPAALVSETRPGALLEPQAEEILLQLLATTSLVVVVDPDGKRHLMYGQYHQAIHEADAAQPLRVKSVA